MSAPAAELRAGDLMFGPIGGIVPGLLPVSVGQTALALSRRSPGALMGWRRWRRIRHAGVVGWIPEWKKITIIQAMPKGAEEVWLDEAKHWTGRHVYLRPDYDLGRPFEIGYENRSQGFKVEHCARAYLGTPYNFLTYAKLAAGVLRARPTEELLRRWISTRKDMMCSQLVDQALADAGYHVFTDGRLPQDVVPAELFQALIAKPGAFLIPGHSTYGQWTDNSLFLWTSR